jgi:hypothetical protein
MNDDDSVNCEREKDEKKTKKKKSGALLLIFETSEHFARGRLSFLFTIFLE